MGKSSSKKKVFWLVAGITAGVLLANAIKSTTEDIDEMVEENREIGGQSKKWFVEKRQHFKELIDDKTRQIEAVSARLKADVIREIDEIKRKELVEKATESIAALKDEIKQISNDRREEFLYYIRKMKATKLADAAITAGVNVKKAVKEKFCSKEKPITDMDFDDFDTEIDLSDL